MKLAVLILLMKAKKRKHTAGRKNGRGKDIISSNDHLVWMPPSRQSQGADRLFVVGKTMSSPLSEPANSAILLYDRGTHPLNPSAVGKGQPASETLGTVHCRSSEVLKGNALCVHDECLAAPQSAINPSKDLCTFLSEDKNCDEEDESWGEDEEDEDNDE